MRVCDSAAFQETGASRPGAQEEQPGTGGEEMVPRSSSKCFPPCCRAAPVSAWIRPVYSASNHFSHSELLPKQTEPKPEHPTQSTGTVPAGWGAPRARTAGARRCGGDFCALTLREPQRWGRGRRGPLGAPRKAVSQLGSCGRALAAGCETFGSPQRWERRTPK